MQDKVVEIALDYMQGNITNNLLNFIYDAQVQYGIDEVQFNMC